MLWTVRRSYALASLLWTASETEVAPRVTTTIDTSMAVMMAMPRSSWRRSLSRRIVWCFTVLP
jgi:hypothetical protein